MNKVALAVLIVLGMLALGYPKRDLVIANTEKIASVFGHELRLTLNLELVGVRSLEPEIPEARSCEIMADTLEAP